MSVKSKFAGTLKALPAVVFQSRYESPLGVLTLLGSSSGLHALLWPSDLEIAECAYHLNEIVIKDDLPHFRDARKQLDEYFLGQRRQFNLTTKTFGTTFQKLAWECLTKIPYGEVITYKDQAIDLGDKNKVRAVGGANGRNPLSIIIPCHRVIAQGGDLRGFGGGLKIKSFLLDLEKSFSQKGLQ